MPQICGSHFSLNLNRSIACSESDPLQPQASTTCFARISIPRAQVGLNQFFLLIPVSLVATPTTCPFQSINNSSTAVPGKTSTPKFYAWVPIQLLTLDRETKQLPLLCSGSRNYGIETWRSSNSTWNSSFTTEVQIGGPPSMVLQSGNSSVNGPGSKQFPLRMWLPIAFPFSNKHIVRALPNFCQSCFKRIAVDRPATPPPTIAMSYYMVQRVGRQNLLEIILSINSRMYGGYGGLGGYGGYGGYSGYGGMGMQRQGQSQKQPGDVFNALTGATSILQIGFSAIQLIHFTKQLLNLAKSVAEFLLRGCASAFQFVCSFRATQSIANAVAKIANNSLLRPSAKSTILTKLLYCLRIAALFGLGLVFLAKRKVDASLDRRIQLMDEDPTERQGQGYF